MQSITLPIVNYCKISSEQYPKVDEEFDRMDKIHYANAVGPIMYIMICNRHVLTHGISILSRFMVNHCETHSFAIK